MSSRIRIKMGQIELEYEGSEDFLKQELPDLLRAVSELYRTHPSIQTTSPPPTTSQSPELASLSTSSISSRLAVNTGPKLIIAAAAKLTLVDKKETFERDELITEMRLAKAYFKANYVNNLTGYLNTLIRDNQINQLGEDSFTLSAPKRETLEKELATSR
jgi:hypothetical protein